MANANLPALIRNFVGVSLIFIPLISQVSWFDNTEPLLANDDPLSDDALKIKELAGLQSPLVPGSDCTIHHSGSVLTALAPECLQRHTAEGVAMHTAHCGTRAQHFGQIENVCRRA